MTVIKKKSNSAANKESIEIWQSISDMMTALLIIFILVLVVITYQSLKKKEQLTQDITDFLNKREQIIADLFDVQKTLAGEGILVCIDSNNGAVSIPSDNLFNSGEYVIKSNESKNRSKNFLSKCPDNENTAIAQGKANISGKDSLNRFLSLYLPVILKPEYRDYISNVNIEGHADPDRPTYNSKDQCQQGIEMRGDKISGFVWTSMANMCLSDFRAQSVLQFIYSLVSIEGSFFKNLKESSMALTPEIDEEPNVDSIVKLLQKKFIVSGRGSAVPPNVDENTPEIDRKDFWRRVEFRLIIDDRKGIQEIIRQLS